MSQNFYLSIKFKTDSEAKRAKLMLTTVTQTGLDEAYVSLNRDRDQFKEAYDAYQLAAGQVTGKGGPTVEIKNEKLAVATAELETFALEIEKLAVTQDNPVLLTQLGFKTTKTKSTRHSQVDFGEGIFDLLERTNVKGNLRMLCNCANKEGLIGFKIRYSDDGGLTWQDGGVSQKFKATVKNLPLNKEYLFACQPFGTWQREGSWTETPLAIWVV